MKLTSAGAVRLHRARKEWVFNVQFKEFQKFHYCQAENPIRLLGFRIQCSGAESAKRLQDDGELLVTQVTNTTPVLAGGSKR
jgi:hypothetical protein